MSPENIFVAIIVGLIFLLLVVNIITHIVRERSRPQKITAKIESMGGKLVHIEKRSYIIDGTPFFHAHHYPMRKFFMLFQLLQIYDVIYRFEYQIKDNLWEGWVRFRGYPYKPEWVLRDIIKINYKEE